MKNQITSLLSSCPLTVQIIVRHLTLIPLGTKTSTKSSLSYVHNFKLFGGRCLFKMWFGTRACVGAASLTLKSCAAVAASKPVE